MYIHSICAHFLYYIIHIKIKILWCFELQMSKNTLNSLKQARILLKSLKWAKIPPQTSKILPKYSWNLENDQNTPKSLRWGQNTSKTSKMTKIPLKPIKWPKFPQRRPHAMHLIHFIQIRKKNHWRDSSLDGACKSSLDLKNKN